MKYYEILYIVHPALEGGHLQDITKSVDEILEKQGVKIRGPVTKSQLVREFREARCILYRGDLNETFCLAIGEAQASGVPAVVRDFGSVVERVKNNETGFIAEDDNTFVSKAIKLMTDDGLWLLYHKRAIELQRNWRWSDVAKAFEKLIE